MALRHPLFVANGTTGVTTPQDSRLALAALLSGPGIISGTQGNVTGSTSGPNMKYLVPAETFATQRGTLATDGLYLLSNDGTVTVDSGAVAPASGSRYDVIYVLARNANDGFGDANSDPVFGVQVGTASSTPAVPAVPTGALALAQALVGTSIANASLATITQVAAKTYIGSDTNWVNITTLSYAAGSPAPQVRLKNGILYARGVLSRGGSVTAGDVPCTTQAGFRPAAAHSWLAPTTGSTMVRLTWDTTGAITVANVITIAGTPTTIFIDTTIPVD
jgi:hypothetical protein